MVSRRTLVAPLMAGLLTLFTVACDGSDAPTPAPTPRPAPTATASPTREPTNMPTVIPTPVAPTLIPTPEATAKLTETPKVEPTVTPPDTKSFELICSPSCTDEQYRNFYKAAEDDWKHVKEFYGLKEGRMVIGVNIGGAWVADFYLGDRHGRGLELSLDDFTPDNPNDRGTKHGMAHAVNYVLLDESIPSWLDEGLVQYASGETTTEGNIDLAHVDKDGKVDPKRIDVYTPQEAYEQLKQNPNLYWLRRRPQNPENIGHILGADLYRIMILDFNLTAEKNRLAIVHMSENTRKSGKAPTRRDVQESYENALGLRQGELGVLFGLFTPGVELFYGAHIERAAWN